MWKKIHSYILLVLFCAMGIYGAVEYYRLKREYSQYRAETSVKLGAYRLTIDAIRARSEIAERGLGEAINSVGTIKDRNRRIEYLVETIRAAVAQIRAIIEGASQSDESSNNSP